MTGLVVMALQYLQIIVDQLLINLSNRPPKQPKFSDGNSDRIRKTREISTYRLLTDILLRMTLIGGSRVAPVCASCPALVRLRVVACSIVAIVRESLRVLSDEVSRVLQQ